MYLSNLDLSGADIDEDRSEIKDLEKEPGGSPAQCHEGLRDLVFRV